MLKKHPDSEFISDIASACNFKRKGLQTILESAMLKNPTLVVVTTKDRLARSGFELIKWLIELSGGRIDILDDPDSSTFDQRCINKKNPAQSEVRREQPELLEDPVHPA